MWITLTVTEAGTVVRCSRLFTNGAKTALVKAIELGRWGEPMKRTNRNENAAVGCNKCFTAQVIREPIPCDLSLSPRRFKPFKARSSPAVAWVVHAASCLMKSCWSEATSGSSTVPTFLFFISDPLFFSILFHCEALPRRLCYLGMTDGDWRTISLAVLTLVSCSLAGWLLTPLYQRQAIQFTHWCDAQ